MTRTVIVQALGTPYDSRLAGRLPELVDPLVRQAEAELLEQGCGQADISFAVKLRLRSTTGGPEMSIDAIRSDPTYDYDAEMERWKGSQSTGYQLLSEMPAAAPFRVHGKSMGHFLGLLPRAAFHIRFLEQTGRAPGEVIVERITVEAWTP